MSLQKLIKHTNDSGLTPVDVEAVKSWFLNNNFQDEINFRPAPFNANVLRGMFRRHIHRNGVYADPQLITDILYAESLNTCWRNFVCTKEMIHIFDKTSSATFTPDALDQLTANLTDPMLRINPSMEAIVDHSAQVRALAVLAPHDLIEILRPSYMEGRRSAMDIAQILMIPHFYVSIVMQPSFAAMRPHLS